MKYILPLLFSVVIICSISNMWFSLGVQVTRDEAVQQHHAEYYLDAKHERKWRWLPVSKEAQP